MGPSSIEILFVAIILTAVLGVVVVIRSAHVRATIRLAPLVDDVQAMLTLLRQNLARLTDDGRLGARQAAADAAACGDAAERLIAMARYVWDCEQAHLHVQYGLSFLTAWIPPLPGGETVPSAVWCGRITATHISDGTEPLVVSDEPLDETPYCHPGGMVAGLAVPAGWYSRPIWSGALRSGVWSAEDLAAYSALFGNDVDTSGFHSGFDPRMPYGYTPPPARRTRRTGYLLRHQLATMRRHSTMSAIRPGQGPGPM